MIIFSWHADSSHIIRAFQVGVRGYLLKGTTGSEAIPAIRAVQAGQRYLSQRIVSLVKKGHLSLPDWVED